MDNFTNKYSLLPLHPCFLFFSHSHTNFATVMSVNTLRSQLANLLHLICSLEDHEKFWMKYLYVQPQNNGQSPSYCNLQQQKQKKQRNYFTQGQAVARIEVHTARFSLAQYYTDLRSLLITLTSQVRTFGFAAAPDADLKRVKGFMRDSCFTKTQCLAAENNAYCEDIDDPSVQPNWINYQRNWAMYMVFCSLYMDFSLLSTQ
jgi:hypothetical protein